MGHDDDLPTAASHPFYRRLNQLLREHGFDDFVEAQCADFYAETMGRPGLPLGIYFRLLLIGYFEGIDAERGIAWRAADSLALRDFLGPGLDQAPPDHSTISRTRRLIALETHRAVFTWILQCCAHLYESGGLRRAHVRGHENVLKRLLIHAGVFNLGLWMRTLCGVGAPRSLQGRAVALGAVITTLWTFIDDATTAIRTPRRDHTIERRIMGFVVAESVA